jgi:hypothetical protein
MGIIPNESEGDKMIRTRLQGGTPFFPNMINNGAVEVCLKEDVDNALAEKDEEIRRLKRALYKACANWIIEYEECRHQKYKRCLAMAKICENKLGTVVKPGWWDKWYKRWLELAEEYK